MANKGREAHNKGEKDFKKSSDPITELSTLRTILPVVTKRNTRKDGTTPRGRISRTLDHATGIDAPTASDPASVRSRPLPALSKAELDRLREVVKEKLAQRSLADWVDPSPAPRIDEVFQRGLEWLDGLAAEPIASGSGEGTLARPLTPPAAG